MLRRKKLRDLESDFFDLNLNSLLLTICKIVHIFFSLCMSQFLQPDSWDQNTIYLLKIMWGLNKIIHENNSVKYLHISSVQLLSRVQLFAQHTRPPCLSPTPIAYSNSCPSSQWCHPTISSSVAPFSSWLQSLPASGCFPMSQLVP